MRLWPTRFPFSFFNLFWEPVLSGCRQRMAWGDSASGSPPKEILDMPISSQRLRPALFSLLWISLVIGLFAQCVAAAEIDVVGLFSFLQWEPGPTVHACPKTP